MNEASKDIISGIDLDRHTLLNSEPATLPELFLRSAIEFDLPNALNYKDGENWKPISSRELIEGSANVAAGLVGCDIRKGDRVAILSANCPKWTISDAGCQFAGVVDVPIYTTLGLDSVKYIINDSGARIFFLENADTFRRIEPILAECPTIERIVLFSGESFGDNRVTSFAEFCELGRKTRNADPAFFGELYSSVGPDDIATLIYTSGTTGEPKGVILTQSNLVSNVLDASEKYEFSPDDVSLSVLPLSHVFERTGMYIYIRNGMRVHYAESIEKVPGNLQEVRPTIFVGVPRIFEKVFERAQMKASQAGRINETIFEWAMSVAKEYAMFLEKGEPISLALTAKHNVADLMVFSKLRDFFGGRLRCCITGGAALPDEIFLIFTGAGIPIMQGYGLTETSPVISSNNPSAIRVGTVGKPIRHVNVRIAVDGEIEVLGPGVMKGYYNKPEATAEVFTDDGWFRTGDIGELDDDGFLKITDRKKELFKTSGGKYIAPSPIEQMLRGSRFISQAVLIGNERKFPAALIVPNFEMLRSYAELKGLDISADSDFCTHPRILDLIERQIALILDGLGQFEKVKKFALLEKELSVENGELTPTLKVKRRVIDERYRDVIENLYS
ncbi:MAG: long-chain fatty acid--CoA ligase [Acidobacteria bacterium]|nr:long-chain fatty acid--CoA ligase [Acidobacteriota bacterium]